VAFDDVMNMHRDIIYKRRRRLLEQSMIAGDAQIKEALENDQLERIAKTGSDDGLSLKNQIVGYIEDEVNSLVSTRAPQNFTDDEYDAIVKEFVKIIPFNDSSQKQLRDRIKKLTQTDQITYELMQVVDRTYQAREKVLGKEAMRYVERMVTISTVDEKWMDHLDSMDDLKDGIWLRGDKQTVLSEYKKEAFVMFESLIDSIESTIASRVFRIHPVNQPIQTHLPSLADARQEKDDIHESLEKEVADATVPTAAQTISTKTKGSTSDLARALTGAKAGNVRNPGAKKEKIGRNEPCPCGSGKKYKKCCLLKE
jgi:preprotein translocase subunit SecA